MLTAKQNELVKSRIEYLHKRGSNDFQSLLRQVEKRKKIVKLNLPQQLASFSSAAYLILEWGRGTGKTTQTGDRWSKVLNQMPRSTGLFIAPTYQFALTRIIPSLVQGLEMFGYYQDLHYFIGKKPPRSWRNSWGTAYQPPENYNRYITFWNGVGVHLISHDVPGDGRGLNADWIHGDEAGLLTASKLQENTDPTLRGTNKREFENKPLFGSRFYTSSTPLTPEGQWFIDYEEKAEQNPEKYNFISATCKWNAENLREGYLDEAKENAYAEWVYLAEYENVRPKIGKNSFYPLLDADVHCYTKFNYSHYHKVGQSVDCKGDDDLVRGHPLILGIDWGASINCLTVNQHLKSINEYRTLKSMFVLGDDQKIQDDLFEEFDKYYSSHKQTNNVLYLFYDNTGNNKTGISRITRAQQAQKQLNGLGWKVHLKTVGGANPQHEWKHILWNMMLRGDHPLLPTYRMNKSNCRELYLSMKHAKTKPGRNGEVKKDKTSETSKVIQRQLATDLSDANDTPVFGMFRHLTRAFMSTLPPSLFSNR